MSVAVAVVAAVVVVVVVVLLQMIMIMMMMNNNRACNPSRSVLGDSRLIAISCEKDCEQARKETKMG